MKFYSRNAFQQQWCGKDLNPPHDKRGRIHRVETSAKNAHNFIVFQLRDCADVIALLHDAPIPQLTKMNLSTFLSGSRH